MDLLDYLHDKVDELLGVAPKPKPPAPANGAPKNGDLLIDFDDDSWDRKAKEPASQLPLTEKVEAVLEALTNVLLHNAGKRRILSAEARLRHLRNRDFADRTLPDALQAASRPQDTCDTEPGAADHFHFCE